MVNCNIDNLKRSYGLIFFIKSQSCVCCQLPINFPSTWLQQICTHLNNFRKIDCIKFIKNPSSCIQQIILPHNINIGPLWSPWSTYKDIYANIKFIFKCFILPMQSANNKMYNVVTYLMCKTKMRVILLVTKSIYQYNLRLCRTYNEEKVVF